MGAALGQLEQQLAQAAKAGREAAEQVLERWSGGPWIQFWGTIEFAAYLLKRDASLAGQMLLQPPPNREIQDAEIALKAAVLAVIPKPSDDEWQLIWLMITEHLVHSCVTKFKTQRIG
jgi:hypothetical protein